MVPAISFDLPSSTQAEFVVENPLCVTLCIDHFRNGKSMIFHISCTLIYPRVTLSVLAATTPCISLLMWEPKCHKLTKILDNLNLTPIKTLIEGMCVLIFEMGSGDHWRRSHLTHQQVGVAVESALATTSQDRLKVLAEVNARRPNLVESWTPLVMTNVAVENGHWFTEFSQ